MKKTLCCTLIALATAGAAVAEDVSWQFSLTPGIAYHHMTDNVTGVAFNIWGMNPQENTFAFGFVNGSYGRSSGLSVGLVNAGENYAGVQVGLVNGTRCDFAGFQAGCVNYVADVGSGFQLGFLNYAGRLTGLQAGLLNMAAQADRGLQLGLVNLIPETHHWFSQGLANECAPAMVFANWRF
jgi:hypothetical protein